jgi:hypothetical protein
MTSASPDNTTQVRELAQRDLRGVLKELGDGHPSHGRIAADLHEACGAARTCGLLPEELLIIVKESRRSLSNTQRIDRHAADIALSEVVSACIREYYLANQRDADTNTTESAARPRGQRGS